MARGSRFGRAGCMGACARVFDRLRGRGALSEADVHEALREVRVALLEADVALPVVKDITAKVRERAVGAGRRCRS
jgi:signal recognition particle GTPase